MHNKRTVVSLFIVATMLLSTMALTAAAPTGLDAPLGQFTIIRDEYGVPHVYAATRQALYYGIGYAQGQDRLWQADLLRRVLADGPVRLPQIVERLSIGMMPAPAASIELRRAAELGGDHDERLVEQLVLLEIRQQR